MPIDSPQSVHVEYTPEFKRSLRKLARKYRSIRTDLEPVIKGLQAGELVHRITNSSGVNKTEIHPKFKGLLYTNTPRIYDLMY